MINKIKEYVTNNIVNSICIFLITFAIVNFVICAYSPNLFKNLGYVVGVNSELDVQEMIYEELKMIREHMENKE